MSEILDDFYIALRNCPSLSGCDIRKKDSFAAVKYPLRLPVVTIADEVGERSALCTGDGFFLEERSIVVSVCTAEDFGAQRSRDCASLVCQALFAADSGRDIVSLCTKSTVYDGELGGFRTEFTLGLRPVMVCEEDL